MEPHWRCPHVFASPIYPLAPLSLCFSPKPPALTAKVSLSDDYHFALWVALILSSGEKSLKTGKVLSIPIHHSLKLPLITSKGLHTAEIEFHLLCIPVASSHPPPLHNPPFTFLLIFTPLLHCLSYFSLSNLFFFCYQTQQSDFFSSALLQPIFKLTRLQSSHKQENYSKQNQRKILPVQSESVSLHFFSTPLAAFALCLSFSQCTAAPPSTSLISCPSLFLSVSARCSMYVSVCEPAEPPVCLHVSLSVLPDLAHLERTKAFLKCPSDTGFSALHISLFPVWIQPVSNPASLSPCFRRHFEFPWQHGAAWIRILCMTVLVSTLSLWWALSAEALDQIYYGAVLGPGDRQGAN